MKFFQFLPSVSHETKQTLIFVHYFAAVFFVHFASAVVCGWPQWVPSPNLPLLTRGAQMGCTKANCINMVIKIVLTRALKFQRNEHDRKKLSRGNLDKTTTKKNTQFSPKEVYKFGLLFHNYPHSRRRRRRRDCGKHVVRWFTSWKLLFLSFMNT